MLKKFWLSLALVTTLLVSVPSVSASTSILPSLGSDPSWCDPADKDFVEVYNEIVNSYGTANFQTYTAEHGIDSWSEFLACGLRLGRIKFWMIPFFVLYALQFVIGLAGLISVMMIVLGGYYYIAGGITDDKEKGKHIITYALGGFVLVLTSWFIVNIILLTLTS